MTHLKAIENPPTAAPPDAGFVQTETADQIIRLLRLLRVAGGGAVTMIAGGSGIGKTAALRHWMASTPAWERPVYVKIARGEGNPSHVSRAIFDGLNLGAIYPAGKGLAVIRREVEHRLYGRMLLVDEAQHLQQRHKETGTTGSSFDWLVAAAEDGAFPLALCGDLTLPTICQGHPMLAGRLRRPFVRKNPTRGDVAAFAATWGVTGAAEVDLLALVAGRPGGLRQVDTVLADAKIDAGDGPITLAHLKLAVQRLGLKGIS